MKIVSFVALGIAGVMMLAGATGNRKVTQNNKLSPPAETSIKLGGHVITIEYNAPSARGRKVEGGLIPSDSVWRLGADSATTLTTDADLMIGDLRVPKGVYTLYLLGAGDGWKLIVNKQTGQWGTEYSEGQDLGRVAMKVAKSPAPVETLKITLSATGAKDGVLEVAWGNSVAKVPVKLA
jgi:hypothetical protein